MDWLAILNNTAQSLLSPATMAFALAALGLAMHFGFAGLLNFGIAGYMAIGAYGYAISVLIFGFEWWQGILVSLVASVVFSLILGIPTLRLRGDYLAIVTIAAAEILRLLFLTNVFVDVTGSADGLSGYHNSFRAGNPFPEGTYGFGPWTYNNIEMWVLVLGLITLVGLITKHGILIVEFANQLREEGMELFAAVTQSATLRLRPILMTTGAMVLGAIPLALASGAGAESRKQIGWVIVGGMSLGTLLTIFVVPTMYTLLARNKVPGAITIRHEDEDVGA
jgi:branched-chain amino acid transport system permease protein